MNQIEFQQGIDTAKQFCRSIAQKVQLSGRGQYDGFTNGRSLVKKSYTEFHIRGIIAGIYEYTIDKSLQEHTVNYFRDLIDGVIAEYVYIIENYYNDIYSNPDKQNYVTRAKYDELQSKLDKLLRSGQGQNNNISSEYEFDRQFIGQHNSNFKPSTSVTPQNLNRYSNSDYETLKKDCEKKLGDKDKEIGDLKKDYEDKLREKDRVINNLKRQPDAVKTELDARKTVQSESFQQNRYNPGPQDEPERKPPQTFGSMERGSFGASPGSFSTSTTGSFNPLCELVTEASMDETREKWENRFSDHDFTYAYIDKGDGAPYILNAGDRRGLFAAVGLNGGQAAIIPSFSAGNLGNPDIRKLFDITGTDRGKGYLLNKYAVANKIGNQFSVGASSRGMITFR